MFTTDRTFGLARNAAALWMFALPAVAQVTPDVFQVSAGASLSNGVNQCTGPQFYNASVPGAAGIVCGSGIGAGSAQGFSSVGHVGGGADMATVTGFDIPGDLSVTEFFRTTSLTFSSTNPAATTTAASVNVDFGGILNAAQAANSEAHAIVNGQVRLFNSFFTFSFEFDGDGAFTATSNFLPTGPTTITPSGIARGLSFQTLTVQVPVNTPTIFEMQLFEEATSVHANASARSDFSGSFKLPTGSDAFNLQSGVTVNDGSWLVNNRFIDPLAVAAPVPEPEVFALLAAGGLFIAVAHRRRLPRTTRASN